MLGGSIISVARNRALKERKEAETDFLERKLTERLSALEAEVKQCKAIIAEKDKKISDLMETLARAKNIAALSYQTTPNASPVISSVQFIN